MKKIYIIGLIVIVLAVAIYFIVKYVKKKKDEKAAEEKSNGGSSSNPKDATEIEIVQNLKGLGFAPQNLGTPNQQKSY